LDGKAAQSSPNMEDKTEDDDEDWWAILT
jgi:hypothetical protein